MKKNEKRAWLTQGEVNAQIDSMLLYHPCNPAPPGCGDCDYWHTGYCDGSECLKGQDNLPIEDEDEEEDEDLLHEREEKSFLYGKDVPFECSKCAYWGTYCNTGGRKCRRGVSFGAWD